MPNVKLESLQQGMIVTSDVRNLDNMLLIPAGCALTDRQINILNSWGIAEIQVEALGDPEDSADPLLLVPPETLEQMKGELRAAFWEPRDTGPVEEEVFNLVLRRRARQILERQPFHS
jgi:hypothetical protein